MKFTKYRSIENSYREKFLDLIRIAGHTTNETYVVEEKIHGANFSVWIAEDGTVKFAKRSSFIADDGTGFFAAHKIADKLRKAGQALRKLLPDVEGPIVVYGELFGGNYPHPDVVFIQDVSSVQKGVYYSPDIHFMSYDLFYGGDFANVSLRQELLQKAGFLTLPILFSGSFEDCLAYDNAFVSTIPEILGLPSIEGNICEGVVIKPFNPLYLVDGTRVILKNKNDKFTEKQKEGSAPKTPEPLSPEDQILFDAFAELCNVNRVAAVCSKIGEVGIKDFRSVHGQSVADAVEEFQKDHPEFLELDKSSRKRLQKIFGSVMAKSVKDYLMAVEKGEV